MLFIIMTLPMSVVSIFYSELEGSETGLMIIFGLDSVSFSYHAFNFIVLFFTNKRLLNQLKLLFKRGPTLITQFTSSYYT